MTDCRSCSTCLNYEDGKCAFTGEEVRADDYCSDWDNEEEQAPVKVRKAKKNKKARQYDD